MMVTPGGSDWLGVEDLLDQWAEEDVMTDLYEPRTQVYRGAEIVWNAPRGQWDIWWLATGGREGYIGNARTVATARRLVDEEYRGGR